MNHKHLYSTYNRIKGNCCEEWKSSKAFYKWYNDTEQKQGKRCYYCQLPGSTQEHYGRYFRKGNRGKRLEVEKKNNNEPYSPENCVLACYPCNNAKSDVFSHDEFLRIGKMIREVKSSKLLNKTVVCYLDILGYTNIIKDHYDDPEVIRQLESLMLGSTSGFMQKAREQLFPNSQYEDYSKQIIDLINVKFISDSIIFTLPLDNIDFSYGEYTDKDTEQHCIIMFLNFVSMFCTLFISHTGYCVRGGISIGKHYERHFNEEQSLFVFSLAYINAYRLEQKAKMPRIILDKVFSEYLVEINFPKIEEFFFDDPQGDSKWVCLDFYKHLLTEPDKAKKVFEHIKRGIMLNLQQNGGDNKIRSKLNYFANYHNKKVTSINLDSRDTIIEIP